MKLVVITKAVFVVGTKNSGKTTVAEFLVRALAERRFKVAAAKHVHHNFTIDTEGKDTYRMRKAGAEVVASFSPSEVAVLGTPGRLEKEFQGLSKKLSDDGFDFLIVEGFRKMSEKVPSAFRILTCKTTAELDSLLSAENSSYDCISGVVSAAITERSYKDVPVIKFPEQANKLVLKVVGGHQPRTL
jgi:molybdopterin-guanine dinucleotide biosynthesis protein MobB